jgi:hypothetical protein
LKGTVGIFRLSDRIHPKRKRIRFIEVGSVGKGHILFGRILEIVNGGNDGIVGCCKDKDGKTVIDLVDGSHSMNCFSF